MNLQEFKAWLEGFEESFSASSPSPEQWKKIKEKLDSLKTYRDGTPVYRSLPPLAEAPVYRHPSDAAGATYSSYSISSL
jgi:hypothetical protein